MSESEKEFLERLLATFRVEADEYIKSISSGLVELENAADPDEKNRLLDLIFRQAHSLKGSARAVDLSSVESICQLMESIFKDFKYKGVPDMPEMFDILQKALDTVDALLKGDDVDIEPVLRALEMVESGGPLTIRNNTSPPPGPAKQNDSTPPPKRRFNREGLVFASREPGGTSPPDDQPGEEKPPPVKTAAPAKSRAAALSTIRVASGKLDKLLLQAEEMIAMKLSVNRRTGELNELVPLLDDLKKKRNRAAAAVKTLGQLEGAGQAVPMEIQGFMDFCRDWIKELEIRVNSGIKALQTDQRFFHTLIDSHLDDMRKALMLPFSSLFESFPRMVRDMARQKGKDIELSIIGSKIEVDRRILEEIKDPMIHLLRNSVDHGIEEPAARKMSGKPAKASIDIILSQKANNRIEVVVSDDGAGIDLKKIKQKIMELDMYSPRELDRMSRQDILSVIFSPEFSTSPIITDLSGRGLGLAIVREKVERLGGRLFVESEPGKGALFRLLLQTTLSTFRGILASSGGRKWVIPTVHVEQAVKLEPGRIKTVENRETLLWGGHVLSYVHLGRVLGLPPAPTAYENTNGTVDAVILSAGDRRMAFQVDDVLDEHEVLVKELGKQLTRVRNIAGATILGSGEVVPILNVVDLMKSAVTAADSGTVQKNGAKQKTVKTKGKKSVLVAEDSITSRMLLKNILESAGYGVTVAVDGMDGWVRLNETHFDLAVLDVEMPRMTGFQLTRKIRENKELEKLPVVLVTSLESTEDREKGIDAGADAYIVKSSFDQSNLIEVIKKMV